MQNASHEVDYLSKDPDPGRFVAAGASVLDAEQRSALYVLGHVLTGHGRFDGARDLFESMLETEPELSYPRRMLIYIHLRTGRYENALDTVERYGSADAGDRRFDPVIELLASKALWGLGRKGEARDRLKRYMVMATTTS